MERERGVLIRKSNRTTETKVCIPISSRYVFYDCKAVTVQDKIWIEGMWLGYSLV